MKLTQRLISSRVGLYIGIFVLLNLLVYKYYFRLDFTADKRYTLSGTTKDILEELDDPITITAYFSEKLPANVAAVRSDFRDLLYEYRSNSDGKVVFEFVNPNESEELEGQTQQQGISPLIIQVRERDEAKQIRAYLGAIIKKGNQQEVLPVVEPGAAMEYALSSSIKRLTIESKTKIGIVQGHGEPNLQQLSSAVQELSTLYDVDTVSLDQDDSWTSYKTLAILAPTDSFPSDHLSKLDEFVSSGGGLFVGINAVNVDPNQGFLMAVNTGLEGWLTQKGINVNPIFLTDVQCGQVGIPQQTPFGVMNVQTEFPYFPVVSNFGDHPITEGLEAVTFVFASPVTASPTDSLVSGASIAFTSQRTGKITPPAMLEMQKQWAEADFPYSSEPVMAYLEGKIEGESNSKIVVVGDGDFPVNQGQGQALPANVNLFVNAVDWLTDDTGLIELRTKGVDRRLIEKQLDDTQRGLMKYTIFLLPILIVIGFGIYRNQMRRSRRVKWMQETYQE